MSTTTTEQLLFNAATAHQAGRLAEAAELYGQVISGEPENAVANHNLGVLAMQSGKGLARALPLFGTAWAADPTHLQHWLSYLRALAQAGQVERARQVHAEGTARGLRGPAIDSLLAQVAPAAATAAAPSVQPITSTDLPSLLRAGEQSRRNGQFSRAEACFRQALRVAPNAPAAHFGLTATLLGAHRFAEAEAACRTALSYAPDSVDAYLLLGDAQIGQHDVDRALDSYQRAWTLRPGDVVAYRKLGTLLHQRRDEAQMLTLIEQRIAAAPSDATAHRDLGSVHVRNGRLEDAVAAFRAALQLSPADLATREGLLFCANYLSQWSAQTRLEESREYGRHARAAAKPYQQWTADPAPTRLRVGLVSGDLRDHVVACFLAPVLQHAPRARIEWFVYSTNAESDATTAQLRAQVDSWRVVAGLGADAIAHAIHADGVHVLVDLAGHSAMTGLPAFAWRPAPVQVSWLGYFASTGLSEIDYVIADRTGVPESERECFTESIWYLPQTRLCFSAPSAAPDVAPLPALHHGYVTFGSFHTSAKLNDDVLQSWAEILRRCPTARLRIQNRELSNAAGRESLMQRLHGRGIDAARVELCAAETRARYLAQHANVDIVLDSFPYTGGTTTCEALWMGVPTVTYAGTSLIARQSASLLTAAGLEDWIADSVDGYVALAQHKAADLVALAELRANLRARVAASALMDGERYANDLADAFWGMWRKHKA